MILRARICCVVTIGEIDNHVLDVAETRRKLHACDSGQIRIFRARQLQGEVLENTSDSLVYLGLHFRIHPEIMEYFCVPDDRVAQLGCHDISTGNLGGCILCGVNANVQTTVSF